MAAPRREPASGPATRHRAVRNPARNPAARNRAARLPTDRAARPPGPEREGSNVMAKRVVLAYSGGLDPSVAGRWMIDNMGVEVIALAVDVGQSSDDWDVVHQRALGAGAVEAVVVDARDEFAREYCVPVLKANALYEGRYPLVSALSRPVIVKHLVAAAREHAPDLAAVSAERIFAGEVSPRHLFVDHGDAVAAFQFQRCKPVCDAAAGKVNIPPAICQAFECFNAAAVEVRREAFLDRRVQVRIGAHVPAQRPRKLGGRFAKNARTPS